jgi:isopenicillin-N N-acyltransferase-like protein
LLASTPALEPNVMTTPCQLVEVAGSPRERGRQYGEAARERVKQSVAHYSQQLAATGLSSDEIGALVARFEPVISGFDPAYLDEMRGIGEGAGVDYEGVVLVNARTEIVKLALRRQRGEADPDGCTGLVALPQATRDGRLIHAQNWDWKVECAETSVALKIRRSDGPDILTFTEAGGLARSGLNAAGIAITANYLECDRDYRRLGVPLALIRRKVLEQAHLALAMRAVYATEKSAANNMIVSHAEGVAIDFECAPDETFQVHAERGLIVHANHFQSPVALSKLKDTGVANSPDSLYRDLRVRGALEPALGAITRETVKAALFDDFETPWSVCRPPRRGLGGGVYATVAMIVMEPALGIMEVAMLPAQNRSFQRFELDMELRPSTQGPARRRPTLVAAAEG